MCEMGICTFAWMHEERFKNISKMYLYSESWFHYIHSYLTTLKLQILTDEPQLNGETVIMFLIFSSGIKNGGKEEKRSNTK